MIRLCVSNSTWRKGTLDCRLCIPRGVWRAMQRQPATQRRQYLWDQLKACNPGLLNWLEAVRCRKIMTCPVDNPTYQMLHKMCSWWENFMDEAKNAASSESDLRATCLKHKVLD